MTFHNEFIKGLRDLADFLESREELTPACGQHFNVFANDPTEFALKARRLGTADKNAEDWSSYFTMVKTFGPHQLELNILRASMCEKKKVGTKIVKKRDDKIVSELLKAVPEVEVEEDVFEWVCPESILVFVKADADEPS